MSSEAAQLKIVGTTFTPISNSPPGTSVSISNSPTGCDLYPCAAGEECAHHNYSLFCSSCASGLVGRDGLRCTQCPPGEQPNANRTQCAKCVGFTYSQFGVRCVSCGDIVDSGRTSCTKCQGGFGPNADRSACTRCTNATYSTSGMCQPCASPNVVNEAQTMCSKCNPGEQPNANRTQCAKCVGSTYSQFGVKCLDTPPGYEPTTLRTNFVDVDECADFARSGCDPLRGTQQGVKACTNMPGGFTCASCPRGYMDGIGNATHRPCVRILIGASSGTIALLPTANLQMRASPAAIDPNTPENAKLKRQLIADLVAALGGVPSDYTIRSIRSRRRRMQTQINVRVQLVISGPNTAATFNNLQRQLANSTSTLMTGTIAKQLVLGQVLTLDSTCPAGTEPSARQDRCNQCPKGSHSSDGIVCIPCPSGLSPNAHGTKCEPCVGANYSISGTCTECAEPSVVDRGKTTCSKCDPGKQPMANRSGCATCVGATYSQFGTKCLPCDRGIVNPTKTTCTPCADGLQPNRPGTACICEHGRFNQSKDTQCYENDYSKPARFVRECVPCAELNSMGSEECVLVNQCNDADFHVRPGWLQIIREDGIRSSVFRCNHETACLNDRCTPGSTGPLCGVCAKDFRRDSSGQCSACGTVTWVGAAVLALILILGFVLLLTVDRWYRYFSTLDAIRGYIGELDLQAITKIVVATGQIIAGFANVLNLEMPYDFQRLLNLLAIFKFDIMSIVGLGCLVDESYANSLAGNVCLVATMIVVSVIIAAVQRNREPSVSKLQQFFQSVDTDGHGLTVDQLVVVMHRVDDSVQRGHVESLFTEADTDGSERLGFDEFYGLYKRESGLGTVIGLARRKRSVNDSLGRLFLLVFLVYPGLTSKIFDIFLCRDLGPGTTPGRVLHADYGVDCDETLLVRNGLGVLLVVIWPIGVPAMLLVLMLRYREAIVTQDENVLRMFQFVVADYKLEYWYWEVVELARKLLLSGLIAVMGRGSVAQSALAAMISFLFFGLSVRTLPFKSRALNAIKIVSEVQLFMVVLMCVILQMNGTNLDAESISAEGYGVMQTVATLAILPIIMGLILYNVRTLQTDLKQDLARSRTDAGTDSEGTTMDNPLHTA
eukprot:COSAG01_NODE_1068_length_11878_cov_45.012395_4_plen_1116_part_00